MAVASPAATSISVCTYNYSTPLVYNPITEHPVLNLQHEQYKKFISMNFSTAFIGAVISNSQ